MRCQSKKNDKLKVDYFVKKGQGLANSRFLFQTSPWFDLVGVRFNYMRTMNCNQQNLEYPLALITFIEFTRLTN
jgi:hypothetical protein